MRNRSSILTAAVAVIALGAAPGAVHAATDDHLSHPHATPIGSFGGIRYIQYDGIFEGATSTGAYRVPYRITAPADPHRGNGTVLVEPPHFAGGLGTLDFDLGRDFLLGRGFAHAGVGYSTTTGGEPGTDLRILDPSVPGVYIRGGVPDEDGRTDDEIIVDFARALSKDPEARSVLGRVDRRYLTGYSDSSAPVMRLVTSGRADGVFDLAFPFTTEGDPQTALADGLYTGKLVIVNSEAEGTSAGLVDRGVARHRYRFYAVAGTGHVLDPLTVPLFSNGTSPASYQPELRAHFLQGDLWVRQDKAPPPSTHLLAARDGTLRRDANGNAISVDGSGHRVPRLPFIELGEARFVTGFVGSYEDVRTIAELGFSSDGEYVKAFGTKLRDYVRALGILDEDADAMRRRAALCPGITFTQMYRDHYDAFVAIDPCGG